MPYRINGTGTTLSPMPAVGQFSISIHWFTIGFLPIIPLGWKLVKGVGYNQYLVIKDLTYWEVKARMGMRGIISTLVYGLCSNLMMLVFVMACIALLAWLRS